MSKVSYIYLFSVFFNAELTPTCDVIARCCAWWKLNRIKVRIAAFDGASRMAVLTCTMRRVRRIRRIRRNALSRVQASARPMECPTFDRMRLFARSMNKLHLSRARKCARRRCAAHFLGEAQLPRLRCVTHRCGRSRVTRSYARTHARVYVIVKAKKCHPREKRGTHNGTTRCRSKRGRRLSLVRTRQSEIRLAALCASRLIARTSDIWD